MSQYRYVGRSYSQGRRLSGPAGAALMGSAETAARHAAADALKLGQWALEADTAAEALGLLVAAGRAAAEAQEIGFPWVLPPTESGTT